MKTVLLLSILIAVSALVFATAYLLVQFVSDRMWQAEDKASDAAQAGTAETGQAQQRPSRRYHRVGERAPRSPRRKTRR